MNNISIVILAAGKGTRMDSEIPKVLHILNHKTLIQRVIDTSSKLKPVKTIVVIGYKKDLIKESLKSCSQLEFATQLEQKGTGHAVKMCFDNLMDFSGDVLILSGDVPLINVKTLEALIRIKQESRAEAAILTSDMKNPQGYGRIVRKDQLLNKIVEHKDCNEQELTINEINAGIYLISNSSLIKYIPKISNHNNQNEYYLPDVFNFMIEDNLKVAIHKITDINEISGVNNKEQLAALDNYLKEHEKSQ
tara:strand:- start:4471 stop:5217 length:747 start_codon:yes stop_codon:yes gene_type:complete